MYAEWKRQATLLTVPADPRPPPPPWAKDALRARGYTVPSLDADPNRVPRGTPAVIPENPTQDPRIEEEIRGLRRENEAASILAKFGFDVFQKPPPSPDRPNAKPDYLIEGRRFEAVSPGQSFGSDPAKNLSTQIDEKAYNQADRIVVNMADSKVSVAELQYHLQVNPVPSYKEVILINKAGNVFYIYP
jgi:hypothetical protein